MKKLLGTLLAVCTFLGVGLGTAYASDCLDIQFDNGDSVCLDIEKNGSKFDVSVVDSNLRRNSSILCYITLPNSIRKTLNGCRGTFSYSSSSTDTVIVSAMYEANSDYIYSERFSTKINFRNGSWVDSRTLMNYSNSKNSKNSKSSSNYNDGDLELSTNKSSPSTNQYVNLTINTDRDYYGKLTLSAKYRSSSSSSRSNISNTSSTYFSSYSDEWEDGYYKMKSSDKGKKTLSNLLKFKKSGYYRIYVKDTDGNESYIQFNVDTSSSSSNRYNNDDLKVSVSPSSPDTYEWVKLTIETDDDYTGKINFSKFQYRSSSSSSWSNISRTSSTYVSDYSSNWSNGYYKMTSSDDGEAILKNLVKFKKSGYYRIYVEDTDGNESYVQINVDTSSSSSSSNGDLEISASPSNPDTYEWVKLTIETDDDYTGKINFSKFQYRSSSSSSWSSISRTSSTYVSDYSDEWEDGYYKMTYSDDGEATLKNLVKFKKSGYYRIYVEDTDGNESYVQINVDTSSSSSSSNGDLEVKASPSSPDTYEWVKLTIETDDDYTGKINFSKFQYRSSSSSSWSTISRTSSTYVSDYSDEWYDGYYRMTYSDDGEKTFSKFVKFKKSGYYRIYIEDDDGNESYVQINVDTSSSSSSSNGDLDVSVSPSNPDTYEWVKLTIETDDDYTGKINFSKFQYRSSSSSSWSNISRTSSTYVSDYSSYWSNGYYKMTYSDDGEVTLKNLIKFKKAGYYRIYVEDVDGNESYVQINVDTSSSSSSSNGEIELSTNRKSPSTSQYVNLTIETDDDYTGKLYFTAKYRSSSSNSRTNISNTSSTYFSNYSDEWEDGYYKMKSSDDGEVTLTNLVKFKKEGYYRISVIDTDGNEDYIEFTVGDADDNSSSSVKGFTSKELSKVKSLYKNWNDTINQLKKEYPSLKRDSYWIELSDELYDNMKDVVNNRSSREFRDYDDFEAAFNKWYKYTYRNR